MEENLWKISCKIYANEKEERRKDKRTHMQSIKWDLHFEELFCRTFLLLFIAFHPQKDFFSLKRNKNLFQCEIWKLHASEWVKKFIVEMQAAAFVFIIVSLTIREGKLEKYFSFAAIPVQWLAKKSCIKFSTRKITKGGKSEAN